MSGNILVSLSELSTVFVYHLNEEITVLLDPEKFPGWVGGWWDLIIIIESISRSRS